MTQEIALRRLAEFNPAVPSSLRIRAKESARLLPMDDIQHFDRPEIGEQRPVGDLLQGYSYIEPTDVAYAKVTPCFENGKGIIGSDLQEPTFASSEVTVLRPGAMLDQQYLSYVLRSESFRSPAIASMTGAGGLKRVDEQDMRAFKVRTPPMAEQRAIADYLDHETAEIDAFIADQERLTDLAHEYEWARLSSLLGYPERFSTLWSRSDVGLVSLKHLGTIVLGKMLDGAEPTPGEETYPYLRAANVQPMGRLVLDSLKSMRFTDAERKRLTLQSGDVIIVEGGGGYGRAAYLDRDLLGIGFQNSIVRFRPHPNVDGRYVAYALLLLRRMGYIEAAASVASMPHFTAEKVAEAPVPESTLAAQRSIANKLDEVWKRAAELDDDLKRSIKLSRERRAALISAAVTGQIDVTKRRRPVAEVLEDEVLEKV